MDKWRVREIGGSLLRASAAGFPMSTLVADGHCHFFVSSLLLKALLWGSYQVWHHSTVGVYYLGFLFAHRVNTGLGYDPFIPSDNPINKCYWWEEDDERLTVESSEGVSMDSIISAHLEFWRQEVNGFGWCSLYGLAFQFSVEVH